MASRDESSRSAWLFNRLAPNTVRVLGPSDAQLAELDERFLAHSLSSPSVSVPSTLLGIALKAASAEDTRERRGARAFLQFVDQIAYGLGERLSPPLVSRLRSEMQALFLDFNANQSNHMNKLAELAVFEYLLRVGASILAFEAPLPPPSTKKADVLIQPLAGSQADRPFVEIVNVHAVATRVQTEADMNAFLDARAAQKRSAKQIGGDAADVLLVIVLWFKGSDSLPDLKRWAPWLLARADRRPAEWVMTLIQLGDENGARTWEFDRVPAIVAKWNLLASV